MRTGMDVNIIKQAPKNIGGVRFKKNITSHSV